MSGSDSEDEARKRRLRHASQRDYEVGYARPPAASRFRPGQSGNPKGRPKGAPNRLPALNEERLKSIVLQEAYRTIKVRDGEKSVSVPMATAVVRAVAVNAAKGNNRAAALFTQMVKVVEDQNRVLHDEWLNTAITYKVEWERELERRKRLGIVAPDPVPHPDHIRIDMKTGQVRIHGPFTKDDIPTWEMFRARKQECDAAIAEYRQDLQAATDPEIRRIILDEIEHEMKLRSMLCKVIPD